MKKIFNSFKDGITSLHNAITNKRNALNTSEYTHSLLTDRELKQIYKSGIGSKIVRLKAGFALNDTLSFETKNDEAFYNKNLRRQVKRACRFMVGFGRGIVVNYYHGDDLSKPLRIDKDRDLKCRSFSGEEVSVSQVVLEFHDERYNKPLSYMIKGSTIHHSRVIDFCYVEPPESDLSSYKYGGISEFEMIYKQLISDGIVERAGANIVDKNSSLFYKIDGFKQALQSKNDESMLEYFSKVEDFRSMHGATLMDTSDNVEVHAQNLANLGEVSDMALRRLAMVTGIPISFLIGENVKGLNSTGDNERQVFQDMIETVQAEYILEPLQELFDLYGLGVIEFKENQGDSAQSRIEYEAKAIDNALKLFQMGEDHGAYLNEREIVKKEKYDEFFKEQE